MSKPRILAVDDEPAILELLQATLEGDGYDVSVVTSAAEFRARAADDAFDVYLVDLGLPDGTGFDLVRTTRQDSLAGIIILTGRGGETDQVLGLELGADDYVTKPFRPRELVARVNAVYRRTVQTRAARIPAPPVAGPQIDHVFDGYRLSSGSRQLWAPDGAEISLTTAEFAVLLALLERRGRVLNRDQIMTLARGREWESYDRAIDGLVSRLRRKIPRSDGSGHYIRTVHGIGYMFGG